MNIGRFIKNALGIKDRLRTEQFQKLKRLPKEQARKEGVTLLYELCVERASDFVNQEFRRGDSPFRGMPAETFLREMLAVTFWLLDKEIAEGKRALMRELHDHYFRSFGALGGSTEDRHAALIKKYHSYDDSWDDIGGYQDEFGRIVARDIFGRDADERMQEKTFWIIMYADDTMKGFSKLKKTVGRIGFLW